jgi:aminoglycoside phosphotransferase (APT) family kinase protein
MVVVVPQWDAEVVVDSGLAGRLVAAQFPALGDVQLRLIGEGWDNTVFAAGEEWVFRFPRREVVLPGLQVEIDVLPLLAPLLPVPIPVPEHVGVPSDEFPWPFFGARILPGVELCAAPETARADLAPQLGRGLRVLHSRDVLDAVGGRLPENVTRRADMQVRVPGIRERLTALDGLWRAPDHVHAVLDKAETLPPPEPRAVCHGDLHFRHVLVDGGRVTGLIDWIDLCRGDPALDLQVVWSALPPEERDAFFAAYGDVDGDTLLRARAVALHVNSMLVQYAHHEGFASIEREAVASLGRAAQP